MESRQGPISEKNLKVELIIGRFFIEKIAHFLQWFLFCFLCVFWQTSEIDENPPKYSPNPKFLVL